MLPVVPFLLLKTMTLYQTRGKIYSLLNMHGYTPKPGSSGRLGPGAVSHMVAEHRTETHKIESYGNNYKQGVVVFINCQWHHDKWYELCWSRGKSFAKFVQEARQHL